MVPARICGPKEYNFSYPWEESAFVKAIFNKEGFFFYPLWAPDPRLKFTIGSTQECLPGMLLAENNGNYDKKFLRHLMNVTLKKKKKKSGASRRALLGHWGSHWQPIDFGPLSGSLIISGGQSFMHPDVAFHF